MVKAKLAVILGLLLCIPAFASDVAAAVDTNAVYLKGKGNLSSYSGLSLPSMDFNDILFNTDVYLTYTASGSTMKGEVKGKASFSSLVGKASDALSSSVSLRDMKSLSLEKAYVKFRFPLFSERRKTTFTVGKAPVSWGKGYYYRVGDALLETEYENEKPGEKTERNIWLLGLEQNFGGGFVITAGYSMPLEKQMSIAAVNMRKSVGSEFLKEAYISYAYRFDSGKKNRLALYFDGTLFFDYVIGGETTFSCSDDFSLVLNLMKRFSILTADESHTLGLCMAGKYSRLSAEGEVMMSLSYDISERLDGALFSSLSISENEIVSLFSSLSLTAVISDFTEAELSLFLLKDMLQNESVYGVSLLFSSVF